MIKHCKRLRKTLEALAFVCLLNRTTIRRPSLAEDLIFFKERIQWKLKD